ncbi:oligopeptide ABC transporter ATP-binding protein OppF [Vibrio diazotrophicus]|uniref:Oligopeptide ABC transporter ATP-binding protein OppF n=2 Tax=Vibrionaceae TaxID=641 RepID=A0A2J8G0N9_VIBDI|nr:oligopeptide ABC transporter ATP-binding protein OppF [Vibrio diazotrophicus]PNI02449.1 oligopeptide ABC transporter ATP-binding protein OppF [Vibrio diazotrophicus]PNI05448.1 oligopeptide ABC transporter ATP-binding protein OppF [Vibrio diazotrophicus]
MGDLDEMSVDKKLLLDVKELKVHFDIASKSAWPWSKPAKLKAVDGVNVRLYEGETLGVVGESGCGKSTFARAIIGLVQATDGEVVWLGQDLTRMQEVKRRETRKDIQMIFQDPLASLNPRMTVGDIIAEPLQTFYPELSKQEVKDRVKEMMAKVGLLPNVINRYPHEFSGGQCQRIGIARALILNPKMIICDEPVSALDVSIQAQVVNLLQELQRELGLSLVFIAHDLSVVKHISDRVLVMYLGNAVELGESEALFANPKHPYTKALMSAVPIPDPKLERAKTIQMLEGDLPSPINPPSGCVFRTRCPQATEICAQTKPQIQGSDTHAVSCLHVEM